MTLNDPDLVHTLAGLHDAYDKALVANDADALTAFFWDSPDVVRFGVGEQLYGAEALSIYRQGHIPPYTSRRLVRREIATFGTTFATVMAEFELMIQGVPRPNRQSQTWVNFPQVGWRIVTAHVSSPFFAPKSAFGPYTEQMARALGLTIAPEHRAGVVANFERTAAIAAPLLAFKLPDRAEPAAVFTA